MTSTQEAGSRKWPHIAVPDGIEYTTERNPHLPAHVQELESLQTRRKVLRQVGCSAEHAGNARVLVVPLQSLSEPAPSSLEEAAPSLQDVTGADSMVVVATVPDAKRARATLEKDGVGLVRQEMALVFGKVEVRTFSRGGCVRYSCRHGSN